MLKIATIVFYIGVCMTLTLMPPHCLVYTTVEVFFF